MRGIPPNCRPQCLINQDCPSTRSCIAGKCIDSCKGACGTNSLCQVINHIPTCSCYDGYEGDPYSSGCVLRMGKFFISFILNWEMSSYMYNFFYSLFYYLVFLMEYTIFMFMYK